MSERNKQAQYTPGINATSLLLILFIAFKLAGIGVVATWSWWWVLSPLWIPFAGVALFLVGYFLAGFVRGIWAELRYWNRRRKTDRAMKKADKAHTSAVDAAMEADRKLRSGEYGNYR